MVQVMSKYLTFMRDKLGVEAAGPSGSTARRKRSAELEVLPDGSLESMPDGFFLVDCGRERVNADPEADFDEYPVPHSDLLPELYTEIEKLRDLAAGPSGSTT